MRAVKAIIIALALAASAQAQTPQQQLVDQVRTLHRISWTYYNLTLDEFLAWINGNPRQDAVQLATNNLANARTSLEQAETNLRAAEANIAADLDRDGKPDGGYYPVVFYYCAVASAHCVACREFCDNALAAMGKGLPIAIQQEWNAQAVIVDGLLGR